LERLLLEADVRTSGEHQGGERSSGDRETLDQLHSSLPSWPPPKFSRPRPLPHNGGFRGSLSGVPHPGDKPKTGLHRLS
jgi:hypothetical protein